METTPRTTERGAQGGGGVIKDVILAKGPPAGSGQVTEAFWVERAGSRRLWEPGSGAMVRGCG